VKTDAKALNKQTNKQSPLHLQTEVGQKKTPKRLIKKQTYNQTISNESTNQIKTVAIDKMEDWTEKNIIDSLFQRLEDLFPDSKSKIRWGM